LSTRETLIAAKSSDRTLLTDDKNLRLSFVTQRYLFLLTARTNLMSLEQWQYYLNIEPHQAHKKSTNHDTEN
jgi:hypothetical protein